jgi:hypothetical protein
MMRALTENEMRKIEGGASAKVKCPKCNKTYKVPWLDRIFKSNETIKAMLNSYHYAKGILPKCSYIAH